MSCCGGAFGIELARRQWPSHTLSWNSGAYALTIFVRAFLLFQVQPIVGCMVAVVRRLVRGLDDVPAVSPRRCCWISLPELFSHGSLRVAQPIGETLPVWTDDYSSIYRAIR